MKTIGLLVVILLAHVASSPIAERPTKQNPSTLVSHGPELWLAKNQPATPQPGDLVIGNIGFPRTAKSKAWRPTIQKPINGTCSDGYRLDRKMIMCRLIWRK